MASFVSLQTLINRTLQRASKEGSIDYTNAGNKFCTAAEITDLLNSSLATEVYDLLRINVGENYFRRTFTFFTQQGTLNYPLPGDFLSLISVDVWLGGNYPISAKRFYENQRNMLRTVPFGWSAAYPVYYQLQGSGVRASIAFRSAPSAGFKIDLNYCPTCPTLVNLIDQYDDVNGWSEIAVLDAATKLLIKSNELEKAQYLEQRKEKMKLRIAAMGPMRTAGEPETVNVIENRQEPGDGWGMD